MMRVVQAVLVIASIAMAGACRRLPDDAAELCLMPAVGEAVVAVDEVHLFPSVSGSPGRVVVPERFFALNDTLAQVRAANSPGDSTVHSTIAPGDQVEVLVADDDPRGFSLVRTRSQTYCWVSSGNIERLDLPPQ